MATNLVASATKLITPELTSRIASMLGIDQSSIEKAISAGVPGLLAAFTALVSRPGGTTRLADAVTQQQPGALANISGAGVAGQRDMIDSGLGTLSSLLGGSSVSTLAQTIGRYAGIGEIGSKGLLGLLGPVVLGVLGQQQRASGLDASGLAQLLQSQSGNVTRAMPQGFARQLNEAGIVDQPVTSMSSSNRPRRESGAEWNWVMPALALLALGGLAWYMFGRNHEQNVATAPPATISDQTGHPLMVSEAEAAQWIGRPVLNSDNVKIGEIVEINRGPDNRVTDIIFDSGTAMGMGAVRYRALANQFRAVKPDAVTLSVKEAEVATVPSPHP